MYYKELEIDQEAKIARDNNMKRNAAERLATLAKKRKQNKSTEKTSNQ